MTTTNQQSGLTAEDIATISHYAEFHTSRNTGINLIAAERLRQTAAEGWTPEHDDQHTEHQLSDAAMCYLSNAPATWPWSMEHWKPKGRLKNLIRAGALIAAEIDRLKRIELQNFKERLSRQSSTTSTREVVS